MELVLKSQILHSAEGSAQDDRNAAAFRMAGDAI